LRRLLACVLLLALVLSSVALAAPGDPKRKINRVDQARATAMLLRKADLSPDFKATPSSPDAGDFYCRALDESDLTLTGDAETPEFQGGIVFVSSLAQVYATAADANRAWQRGVSPPGQRCARDVFRREIAGTGAKFVSFGRVAFPRLAQRSVAYRLVLDAQGVRLVVDVVVMHQTRAQAAVLIGAALSPVPKSEKLRLARLVAARMERAMQGG
jgi:hypothetical protein